MAKRGAPSLHHFVMREAATTGRQSKQRVQALRDLKEWAPATWSRIEDGWSPTRYSTEPPLISPHVMAGIIRDNLVVVITRTDRGAPWMVKLRERPLPDNICRNCEGGPCKCGWVQDDA